MAIAFIRTLIVYVVLVAALRFMGKRQLGELAPSELVVAVLISDLTAHPLQDIGIPLLYGLIPALTLLCCELIISGIAIKNIRFHSLICGRPSIIIRDGQIVQAEMRKNRFTLDELNYELRKSGVTDIRTVQHAVLETDGSVSILLYPADSPLTPRQMDIPADAVGYPVILINDGRVLRDNLRLLGYGDAWLEKQLKQHKIRDTRAVYYMTADKDGQIYLAAMDSGKGGRK